MTKHRSRKSQSHPSHKRSQSRTMRREQYGGELAGNPASAWGWGMGTLGNGWTQFMNSLTIQPGQNIDTIQSNNIVPVGAVPQDGGKTSYKRKSNAKRGGNVFAQAVVPLALITMNNTLGSRRQKHRNRRTRIRR